MSRLAINIKYHSVVKALTPFQFIRPRSYHFLALFVCQSVTICFVNFKLKFAQDLSKLPHGFVRQLRGYVTVITFIFQVVACTIFCPLPNQTKLKFEARCYCFRCWIEPILFVENVIFVICGFGLDISFLRIDSQTGPKDVFSPTISESVWWNWIWSSLLQAWNLSQKSQVTLV